MDYLDPDLERLRYSRERKKDGLPQKWSGTVLPYCLMIRFLHLQLHRLLHLQLLRIRIHLWPLAILHLLPLRLPYILSSLHLTSPSPSAKAASKVVNPSKRFLTAAIAYTIAV